MHLFMEQALTPCLAWLIRGRLGRAPTATYNICCLARCCWNLGTGANMEDYVAELAREAKLERVSTYRMTQAISHIIYQLTNGAKSLDASSVRSQLNPRPACFSFLLTGVGDIFFLRSPSILAFIFLMKPRGRKRACSCFPYYLGSGIAERPCTWTLICSETM